MLCAEPEGPTIKLGLHELDVGRRRDLGFGWRADDKGLPGALASTATIGAAKGRSVTPTVPCDAPGQRRVECTNDHCKWA